MKRLFLILLLLLPLPAQAFGPAIMAATSAGGACANNPATDYVGDKTDYSSESGTFSADVMYCQQFPAPSMTCATGTLSYGNANAKDSGDNLKICVYNNLDAASAPTVNDTLVGCTNDVAVGTDFGWVETSQEISQAVSNSSTYFICFIPQSTITFSRKSTGATGTLYYELKTGSHATPPANLAPSVSWSQSTRNLSLYVKIR